jgi:hypothetical protein
VVMEEEIEHYRFAARDLAVLESAHDARSQHVSGSDV